MGNVFRSNAHRDISFIGAPVVAIAVASDNLARIVSRTGGLVPDSANERQNCGTTTSAISAAR
jgi:hypothetical protein